MTERKKMTREEARSMFAEIRGGLPHSATLREELREKIEQLPDVAKRVYLHHDLEGDEVTPLIAAETVLYSFDPDNYAKVAEHLQIAEAELQLVLIGFVLGAAQQNVLD